MSRIIQSKETETNVEEFLSKYLHKDVGYKLVRADDEYALIVRTDYRFDKFDILEFDGDKISHVCWDISDFICLRNLLDDDVDKYLNRPFY